jgi:predicted ATPase
VTFLFTDVEGSTALLRALGGNAYAEELARHRRVLREAIDRHHGVEVDTQGDAFFVAFASARRAVAAALGAQQVLEAGLVGVRMGLHTGEGLPTDEGYVGLDVHRAARIAGVAHGGQVVLSAATRQLLGSDVRVRDLGEHRLKDLSAPERLYQLGDREFPPLTSLYRTNLPVPATAFLGRERELAEVAGLLQQDGVRLLTLTGTGGTGKTRLALQAAAEVSDGYPDGVWWVPLASVRDPDLVFAQAARTVESRNGLAVHISDRRLLVLFDNFEHVIAAAQGLAELLSACPNLKLLVTSRELLRLSAEHEYVVPPLEETEALRLFRERAFRDQPDEQASEICRRLDCLPLAIELAAARTKALSANQILERVDHRLPLLTRGARDAPDRQRTLRATIEWSFNLLNKDEQRLFGRLAVFSGGCTLEAAEQVVEAELDTLQSLVEKSLLRHSEERFWILETIREYAAEQLDRAEEKEPLTHRHATYFADLVEEAGRALNGPYEKTAREHVAPDTANVVAATEWARTQPDANLLLRLAVGGEVLRLPPRQQILWLDEALSRFSARPTALLAHGYRNAGGLYFSAMRDLETAQARLEKGASIYRQLNDPAQESDVRRLLGAVLGDAGDQPAARATLERALALAREPGGRPHAILHHLGELERDWGDTERAAELLERAIEAARREGDSALVAHASHGLGDVLFSRHNWNAAEKLYRESFLITFALKNLSGCLYCLRALAAVAAEKGQDERAGLLWGAADAHERESGYTLRTRDAETYKAAIVKVANDRFEQAVEEGTRMTLADALAYAATAEPPNRSVVRPPRTG